MTSRCILNRGCVLLLAATSVLVIPRARSQQTDTNQPSAIPMLVEARPFAQPPSRKRVSAAPDATTPLFLPAVTYSSGPYSVESAALAVADVNGDGKLDLIVTGGGPSPGIGVLLGNGDGTFQPTLVTSPAWVPGSVAVADVNGDGKPDLVIATCCESNGDGEAAVLLGNGDGSFQAPIFYDSGGGLGGPLAVADLTGNGIPDIVISNWDNSTVGVLLGNGDGTFQAAMVSSSGADPEILVISDVNRDGKLDLLQNGVTLRLGSGGGNFQSFTVIPAGSCQAGIAVADLDGDGVPDLVVTNSGTECFGGGFVGVLLGNGDGTFQPEVNYDSGTPSASGVAIADINGDGKPDLLVANSNCTFGYDPCAPGAVGVLIGNGDGTFQAATLSSTGGGVYLDEAFPIAAADLNGDGRPDVVVAQAGTVAVLLNNTGPHAPTTTALSSNANPSAFSNPVTYTATVTNQSKGAIAGTVTFVDASLGVNGVLGNVPLVNDRAMLTIRYGPSGTGIHPLTASYFGDTKNSPSTSATLTERVEDASRTSVKTSGSPSFVSLPVTFAATVASNSGAIPNGEVVTFYDGSTAIGTGTTKSGVAAFTTASLTAKTHTIKASYAGDATYEPSAGTVTQEVEKYATTTTLASSPNPAVYGQTVTWTVRTTTSGALTPTGEVSLKGGGYSFGPITLNASGVAALTKLTLNVASYPLAAVYAGDATNAGSTSAILTQVVEQTSSTATLTSSPNSSTQGELVTFTAKITSPTVNPVRGEVTFTAGETVLGTGELSGGQVQFKTSALAVGSTTVTATYNGDSNIAKSSASVEQTVQP